MMFAAYLVVCFLATAANAQSSVRLVDGISLGEGRVEVLYNGEWGTVCDDGWDWIAANVVCRSLGLGAAIVAFQNAIFGQGTGTIVLDDVSCSGGETSIFDCGNEGLGTNNCDHSDDAGVICANGVRLVAGSNASEGRVEVYYNGAWGTICDDSWDDTDARVVCRSLGFHSGTGVLGSPAFGQGSGEILLDDISCTGTETNIGDCSNAGFGVHNCGHFEDAGVRCSEINFEDVRLVDGFMLGSGRVEVFYNGEWGTVCDDRWDLTDAYVVCRSLGLGVGIVAFQDAFFGQGTGTIVLDDVSCSGGETSIFDCGNAGLGTNNCGHSEDAGVICANGVRLVDGSDASEGRVEVYINGGWGTVCDDSWDDNDARVVCRVLGFDSGTGVGNAEFGQGSGDIHLDDVSCTGTETDFRLCSNAGFDVHNCTHFEDAGVRCSTVYVVRLVDGSDESEGRVEVYTRNNGAWGTVCDDSWDDTDAGVVCQSLGFDSGTGVGSAEFGQGSGDIVLDDVSCTGTETNLGDCSNAGFRVHNCTHFEDAGVRCSTDVRLVDGITLGEGRVEVLYNGEWGTVCDDGWDLTDANVVCESLGLGAATDAFQTAFFGQGTGTIVLDDVSCSGDETSIFDCGNAGLGTNNCGHSEDASVKCENGVRLVAGSDASEGRVEVYNNGAWGTVCDDSWDDTDAGVVCRSLGFDSGTGVGSAEFGQGLGDILLDDVSCTGIETDLGVCSNAGFGVHNCAHFQDAGVRCSTVYVVRLVDGSDESEGRVEVYTRNSGAWGTVCDDSWDDNDAGVVCRSLGFDSGTGVRRAEFGEGSGDIFLDDVSCTGTETNLGDCSNAGFGVHDCGHSEDAGVFCSAQTVAAELRLVDGTCNSEGRVEIFYDAVWGTICDDFWDDTDAGVVCRSLGYSSGTAVGSAEFGQGSGPIIFDDVECSAGDTALEYCRSNPPFDNNCSHFEDAGVRCTE